VRGDGFSIPLNPEIAFRFKNYPHKHLYIGIRPHDLYVTYDKNQHHYFECRKIFQEYIGSQMIIHADCHGQTIQFEISAYDGLKPIAAEFYLECVPNHLHFFDYKTEIRIV
jgi:ABC-type sugar transport system ATPase subunit